MSSENYIYCYQGTALRIRGTTSVIGKKDPYNPLGLGYGTMRLKFADGYTPTVGNLSNVLVDAGENIWDCTSSSAGVPSLPNLRNNTYLISCVSANMRRSTGTGFVTGLTFKFFGCTNLVSVSLSCTDHVTDMRQVFYGCTSLTSVPLFDTRSCSNMSYMFFGCTSLTTVPLFDTSSCTNMSYMFSGCTNVQSGSLALYQQASTQTTPPTTYTNTFTNCGSNTVTGAAELAQIPTSWGGTMAE
ncbi:MAG: BspA family leucine-rich repeat surface protein [Clostridiales bacterium]|nr:BspA family leucine-rich repeat surface protein [Clostridiales bacterium]